jgi:hypothetical protein
MLLYKRKNVTVRTQCESHCSAFIVILCHTSSCPFCVSKDDVYLLTGYKKHFPKKPIVDSPADCWRYWESKKVSDVIDDSCLSDGLLPKSRMFK